MKTRSRWILMVLLLPLFLACGSRSNEQPEVPPTSTPTLNTYARAVEIFNDIKQKRAYNEMVSPYIVLTKDSLYKIEMTNEEAERIGLPLNVLVALRSELEETNAIITQYRAEGKAIEVTDPKEITPEERSLRNDTESDEEWLWQVALKKAQDNIEIPHLIPPIDPSKPDYLSGTLNPTDQEEAYYGLAWVPSYVANVIFYCRTNAALSPVFTCATYSSGS